MSALTPIRNAFNIGPIRPTHPDATAGGLDILFADEGPRAQDDIPAAKTSISSLDATAVAPESAADTATEDSPQTNEHARGLSDHENNSAITDSEQPAPAARAVGRTMLEAARKTVTTAFRAPGYLSGLLDRKLGDVYATVRYSHVNPLIEGIADKASEHGSLLPIAAVAGKIVSSIVSKGFDVLPDILPDNLPDSSGRDAAPAPAITFQHENPSATSAIDVATSYEPKAPATPAEIASPPDADEPDRHFTAVSGDTTWKTVTDSLEHAAKKAGIDPEELTSAAHITEAMKAFTQENESDLFGKKDTGMYAGVDYTAGDLDRVSAAMANDMSRNGDGHLNDAQFKAAVADAPEPTIATQPETAQPSGAAAPAALHEDAPEVPSEKPATPQAASTIPSGEQSYPDEASPSLIEQGREYAQSLSNKQIAGAFIGGVVTLAVITLGGQYASHRYGNQSDRLTLADIEIIRGPRGEDPIYVRKPNHPVIDGELVDDDEDSELRNIHTQSAAQKTARV